MLDTHRTQAPSHLQACISPHQPASAALARLGLQPGTALAQKGDKAGKHPSAL